MPGMWPVGFIPIGMNLVDGDPLSKQGNLAQNFDVNLSNANEITLLDSLSGSVLLTPVSFSDSIGLLDDWTSRKFPSGASKRQPLLPPYLSSNPVWTDFIFSTDTIWELEIDEPITFINKIRQLYLLTAEGSEDKITNGEMLTQEDFDFFERDLLVKQTNLLGFVLQDNAILTIDNYKRLFRNIGSFWYEKGKKSFIDFVGFVLNANIQIYSLYSYDYAHFEPDSSAKDVDLDHTGGGYASVAHNTNQTPTSKLVIQWLGSLTDYTNGTQTLVSKWGAAGNRGYALRITNAGNVEFVWSTDGTASSTATSTVVLPAVDGNVIGMQVEFDITNNSIKFSHSTNMRLWTQLGDALTGATAPFSSTAALAIAAANAGTENLAVGKTKHSIIIVDGSIRGEFEGIFGGHGGTSFTDRFAHSWTINAPATLAEQNSLTLLPDGGSWYPTTHVDVAFTLPSYSNVTTEILTNFFYEFANYNLVLRNIIQTSTIQGKAEVSFVGAAVKSASFNIQGQANLSMVNKTYGAIGIGAIGVNPIGMG